MISGKRVSSRSGGRVEWVSLSLGQNVGGLVASYPLTKNDFNSVGGGNPKGEGGDRAEEDRGVQDPIIGRGRRGFEGVRWLGRSCEARMRGFPIGWGRQGLPKYPALGGMYGAKEV